MKDLINIEKSIIGDVEVKSINSRDLHLALELKKDFTNWIKKQIESLGLEENIDYIIFLLPLKGESKGKGGDRRSIDYIITLDTAKHIAMASRTSKGKEVRNYYIQIEKEFINLNCSKELTPNLDYSGGKVAHIFHNHQLNPTAFLNVKLINKLEKMFGIKNTRKYYSEIIGIEIDEVVAQVGDSTVPIKLFVDDKIMINIESHTKVIDLYEAYKEWIANHQELDDRLSKNQFSKHFGNAIKQKSYQKRTVRTKTKSAPVFCSLRSFGFILFFQLLVFIVFLYF